MLFYLFCDGFIIVMSLISRKQRVNSMVFRYSSAHVWLRWLWIM